MHNAYILTVQPSATFVESIMKQTSKNSDLHIQKSDSIQEDFNYELNCNANKHNYHTSLISYRWIWSTTDGYPWALKWRYESALIIIISFLRLHISKNLRISSQERNEQNTYHKKSSLFRVTTAWWLKERSEKRTIKK